MIWRGLARFMPRALGNQPVANFSFDARAGSRLPPAALREIAMDAGTQLAIEHARAEDGDLAASVYFATFEDADAFAAAYPFPVVGIVEVRTFCLE